MGFVIKRMIFSKKGFIAMNLIFPSVHDDVLHWFQQEKKDYVLLEYFENHIEVL